MGVSMITEEAIDRALLTYGEWTRRLARAIDENGGGLSVSDVSRDDRCELGNWLHVQADADIRSLPIYERVRRLHADFHAEAGRILAMAQTTRRFEAMEAIGLGSELSRLAGALVLVLDQLRFRVRRAIQELPVVPK